ncbi:MAG TPA: SH3 domain-containing protein, partial [Acidimicrobiia bacterium]
SPVRPTLAAPAPTTTTLAGNPIEFGPREGDVIMVIGVRHDDVLNLRAGPGADQPIVGEIPPTFTSLVALGNTRDLDPSFWIEVDYEGTVGWVHMGFIGFEGMVTDETSHVVAELGERPVESTMTDLAEVVADVFDSDSEPESDIVQVTPVTTGDLAEVTYDVIGLGDDSVGGSRLHIFAEETDDGFSLRSVEVTTICLRGVDEDRICT